MEGEVMDLRNLSLEELIELMDKLILGVRDLRSVPSEELIAELERRREEMPRPKLYYYGVWPGTGLGHFVRDSNGWNDYKADELFTQALAASKQTRYPWGDHENRGEKQEQGLFFYKIAGEMSLISCWDRTGDSRGNSCSAFLCDSLLEREQLLALARQTYPAIFERMELAGISIGWWS